MFSVHLSEEAEDAAWLLRDAMVRPAEVLVVPYLTRLFWLLNRKKKKRKYIKRMFFTSATYTEVSEISGRYLEVTLSIRAISKTLTL